MEAAGHSGDRVGDGVGCSGRCVGYVIHNTRNSDVNKNSSLAFVTDGAEKKEDITRVKVSLHDGRFKHSREV
jgi:hypothetical protein